MRTRFSLLISGPVVVALYAAVMVTVICVWDPVAAVPTLSHADILIRLRESSAGVTNPFALPVIIAGAGVVLSLAISFIGALARPRTKAVAVMQLAIVAGGAPAVFIASFPLGMDVADTFGVSGGAHTPWTGVLYLVSLAAGVAAVAVAFRPTRVPSNHTLAAQELSV